MKLILFPFIIPCKQKDRGTRLVKDKFHTKGLRPYTTTEYARLQVVPDWFHFAGNDSQVYKKIGNGVPVVFGEWIGRAIKRYFGK
ncbi:MAG: DNA cytosine methyltransferase [Leptospiraceae bacterium]|nr:DNA cytosine methyltransferase [Leptospiraceae bacterium]